MTADIPACASLRRELGLTDATAIFVGIVLGSGIFVAPSAVAAATSSPAIATLLWAVGALVALAGAVTYAECGSRLPHTGGFYVYYREAFGLPAAFVGGWVALLVTYPASLAAIALLCARYLNEVLAFAPKHQTAVAALAVIAAMVLSIVGVHTGGRTQRLLTSVKIVALLILCAAALFAGQPVHVAQLTPRPDVAPTPLALLGVAVVVLWTYDGWSDITLVAGEIRAPERNLRRVALLGTFVLATIYIVVQLSVLHLLPAHEAAQSERVLSDAVAMGLGPRAGALVALLIVTSTFGSLHGIVFTSSRLAFAMANDGVFLRSFGTPHRRWGTPARATLGVGGATLVYVFSGGFDALLGFFSFSVWLFYGLTAVALLRLRRRDIGTENVPSRVTTRVAPLLLMAVSVGMTASLGMSSPQRTAMGLALMLGALPAYWLWRRRRR